MRMKRTTWITVIVLGFCLAFGGRPARGEAECPFGNIGENVVLAFSMESWNAMWEMARAPGLGDQLAVSIRDELLPAILESSDASGEFEIYLDDVKEISEKIDWKGLAASRLDLLLWGTSVDDLKLTLKISPPPDQLDSVEGAVVELLKSISEKAPEVFYWRDEDGERAFCFDGPVESASADEIFHVNRYEEAMWITAAHTAPEAFAGPGLAAREHFSAVWEKHPSQGGVSFVLDFGSLANQLHDVTEVFDPVMTSTLVLDATMEEIFKNDPETFEKLKQAQEGMDFWSGEIGGNPKEAAKKGIDLLESLGMLSCRITTSQEGMFSGAYWRPTPGGEGGELLEMKPLSDRGLSLLEIDVVDVAAQGLPDFGRIYDKVIELIGMAPFGKEILENWAAIQDSIDFHPKKDLFPAFGREVGWVSRQVPKGAAQSFPIATNELYVFHEIADASTARGALGRLEELLSTQGIGCASKPVGDFEFTEVDTGFLGKAIWGILEDPPVLVFSKGGDLEFLQAKIDDYRSGKAGDLTGHPRWESMKSLWKDNPTAVRFQNAGLVQNQLKGQLQSAQMMIAMMGAGDPVVLAAMGLGMQALNGLPTPDWYLQVDNVEGDVRVSRSLLLYPMEEEK
jgi:hypothetical protein